MSYTVISSGPSPFARKVRIALLEKGIPFELKTEVPWHSETETPKYNPLEKLPVLIFPDGKGAIYESHYILDWLETKFPDKNSLVSRDNVDEALLAKQIEVVVDGVCDAFVLLFFENARGEGKRSEEWAARQQRKVDGGFRALADWYGADDTKEFLVGGKFGLADAAAGSLMGWLKFHFSDQEWRKQYPQLETYLDRLEQSESFKHSRPGPMDLKLDKIV